MATKEPLANILGSLDVARAPDVRSQVTVPLRWLERGDRILVAVPRLAACDACGGGGCEHCARRGAFTLFPAEHPREPIELCLPRASGRDVVVVRLAHQGVQVENTLAGHWLLEVRPGENPSSGVKRCAPRASFLSTFVGAVLRFCGLRKSDDE